jgi:hypothetical protein
MNLLWGMLAVMKRAYDVFPNHGFYYLSEVVDEKCGLGPLSHVFPEGTNSLV